MKQKTGQLFWGFLLLSIGILYLIERYTVLFSDWEFVWNLWPLVLIFWGILVLTKESIAKPFVSILFGIFIGVMIYGTFADITIDSGIHYEDDEDYSTHTYSEEFDSSITKAYLEVNSGAGKFLIERTTDDLAKANSKGNFADYSFVTERGSNSASVYIDFKEKKFNLFGRKSNFLEVQLNDNPIWDMEFNIGASGANFDLSKFKVRNIGLNTGASNTKITLGDKTDEINLEVNMGAASLEIFIPENSGCHLTGDMVLFSKKLDGFIKDSGSYKTNNYKDADNKIYIRIEGGVSKLKIFRY